MKTGFSIFDYYLHEREIISQKEIEELLDKGRKWNLGPVLADGGSAIFPHTFLKDCGDQIAAVVQGCFDAGAAQVLALGVIHANTIDLRKRRRRSYQQAENFQDSLQGIFGAGFGGPDLWKNEYSLLNFQFLWEQEAKMRGIRPPKLKMLFPFLAAGCPENLRGMEELRSIAKDSIVVITGDLCHHGTAYGTSADQLVGFGRKGEGFAHEMIDETLKLLSGGNYRQFLFRCGESLNDAVDSGVVLRHLLGPFKAEILDLRLINVETLFENDPGPSWVASSLVSIET